jgi:hypothetical protein
MSHGLDTMIRLNNEAAAKSHSDYARRLRREQDQLFMQDTLTGEALKERLRALELGGYGDGWRFLLRSCLREIERLEALNVKPPQSDHPWSGPSNAELAS